MFPRSGERNALGPAGTPARDRIPTAGRSEHALSDLLSGNFRRNADESGIPAQRVRSAASPDRRPLHPTTLPGTGPHPTEPSGRYAPVASARSPSEPIGGRKNTNRETDATGYTADTPSVSRSTASPPPENGHATDVDDKNALTPSPKLSDDPREATQNGRDRCVRMQRRCLRPVFRRGVFFSLADGNRTQCEQRRGSDRRKEKGGKDTRDRTERGKREGRRRRKRGKPTAPKTDSALPQRFAAGANPYRGSPGSGTVRTVPLPGA